MNQTLRWLWLTGMLAGLILIYAGIAITVLRLAGNQPKLDYVMNSEILNGYKPAIRVRQLLKTEIDSLQYKIDSEQTTLNAFDMKIEKGKKSWWPVQGLQQMKTQLQVKQQELAQYVQGAQQSLNVKKQEMMTLVYKEIDDKIALFTPGTWI